MYEKPHFQGLRKNFIHSFICVILIGIQVVGMNFRNEDSECFQLFHDAQNDTEDGENINENVCRRIAKLMLINLFFLLKSLSNK